MRNDVSKVPGWLLCICSVSERKCVATSPSIFFSIFDRTSEKKVFLQIGNTFDWNQGCWFDVITRYKGNEVSTIHFSFLSLGHLDWFDRRIFLSLPNGRRLAVFFSSSSSSVFFNIYITLRLTMHIHICLWLGSSETRRTHRCLLCNHHFLCRNSLRLIIDWSYLFHHKSEHVKRIYLSFEMVNRTHLPSSKSTFTLFSLSLSLPYLLIFRVEFANSSSVFEIVFVSSHWMHVVVFFLNLLLFRQGCTRQCNFFIDYRIRFSLTTQQHWNWNDAHKLNEAHPTYEHILRASDGNLTCLERPYSSLFCLFAMHWWVQ